MVRVTLDLRF